MIFSFDTFELDTDKFELREAGRVVPIEPQVFQVLRFLIENQDRMISRDELIQQIWQGRAVSDWAISSAVKSARLALGDTEKTKRYIRTIHGKGFRFIGAAIPSGETSGPLSESAGRTAEATSSDRLSIAVVPFANLIGSPDQDYFADGISEDLITDLSNISGLSVASRNSSFRFKGQALDVRTVGQRLKVGHVLEGSVRRSGSAVRINAQLVEAETGAQLWAERFDGEHADIFALQDDINERIVSSLKLRLAVANRGRRPTRDPEAYDLCLRGRSEYYLYTPDHLAKALAFFEQAVAKDPNYAEAYAYQSYCRCSMYVFAWPSCDDTLERAVALAERAISLDDGSAVAHARLGWILGYLDRIEETVASFERAIRRAPNNAEVYQAYGETMNRLGKPLRALPLLDKALSIDTFVPPSWQFAKGHSFVLLRQYEDALSQFMPVLERVPRFLPARVQLARLYAEMGRAEEASETVAMIREIAPRYGVRNARRMFPYPDPAEHDRFVAALQASGLPD